MTGQPHAPANSTSEKDPVPIVLEGGWASGPFCPSGKSRPHWDSMPDRPASSQCLYRLSYRTPAKSTPGKDTVPIILEGGWASGPVCPSGKSRLHWDSMPARPASSQSQYRLSYRTPANSTSEKDPVPIVLEGVWASGPVCPNGKSRPHWDSMPDRPASSQSQYRLSYRTPANSTPGKDPVPIIQEGGWVSGPVCPSGKSRLHWDSMPDRPASSQCLYRLSYRTPANSTPGKDTVPIVLEGG